MEFYGDKIRLNFSLEKTEVDYFYKIFFNYTLNKESKTFETEQIQSKEEGSSIQFNAYLIIDYFFYKYQKLEITVQKLKKNRGLRNFEIWENRISLSTIISSKNCIFKTPISLNNQENIIIHVEKEKGNNNVNISLFDYIKSGILFKSFIAIDFSDNEYHILSDQKNQYLLAIKGFRKILYDFSRLYEVYGFGNNLNINKKEQFFNLSKDENFCEIEGYTNIFLAYIEILNQIKFEDNILLKEKKLSPLIKYLITKIMNQQNPNYYNIIFLLINSLSPNDYHDCVDVFIQASFLPLSFVVIGIGVKQRTHPADANATLVLDGTCNPNAWKNVTVWVSRECAKVDIEHSALVHHAVCAEIVAAVLSHRGSPLYAACSSCRFFLWPLA